VCTALEDDDNFVTSAFFVWNYLDSPLFVLEGSSRARVEIRGSATEDCPRTCGGGHDPVWYL